MFVRESSIDKSHSRFVKVYNPFWKYISFFSFFFWKNTCKYYVFECIDSFFFLPEHHYTAGLYFVIYFCACLVLLHWLSVSLSNLISFFFIRSSNDNFHHQMKIFSFFFSLKNKLSDPKWLNFSFEKQNENSSYRDVFVFSFGVFIIRFQIFFH